MTNSPSYRKLVFERSVLLAQADVADHGPILLTDNRASIPAHFENRCDSCGYMIRVGDMIRLGYRSQIQSKLWVHAVCPYTYVVNEPHDLFDQMPWLTRWEGADIIIKWTPMSGNGGSCVRCQQAGRGRPWRDGELAALVRRPGRMHKFQTHSDYICEGCVRR